MITIYLYAGEWCKYSCDSQFSFGGSNYHNTGIQPNRVATWLHLMLFHTPGWIVNTQIQHTAVCVSLPFINCHVVLHIQEQVPEPNTDNVSNSSFSLYNGKPIPSCLGFISEFYKEMSWINYIFGLQYHMWTVLSHAMRTSILMKLSGTADHTVEDGKHTLQLSSLWGMPWSLPQLLVAL